MKGYAFVTHLQAFAYPKLSPNCFRGVAQHSS